MRALTATILFFALLSGCSKPIQRPVRAFTVEAPLAWRAGEVAASDSGVDWWAYFGDRGLDLVISAALTKNHDLRAAVARIEAARQDLTPGSAHGGSPYFPRVAGLFRESRIGFELTVVCGDVSHLQEVEGAKAPRAQCQLQVSGCLRELQDLVRD